MVHHRLLLWLGLVVLVASSVVSLPPPPTPTTKLYIGQSARLTAQIPAGRTVPSDDTYDYSGRDGFIVSRGVAGQTLETTCSAVAASPAFDHPAVISHTNTVGQVACRLTGTSNGERAAALVIPHPHPFTINGTRYAYAALLTDAAHFASITATLSFSPDQVTPTAFILSVIDLLQARAYWGNRIDWSLVRQQALAELNGLPPDLAMARGALAEIMQWLRASGDNHSSVLFPGRTNALAQAAGYGLLVGGQRVLAVFPDGPAARAGVRAGDVITAVDGQPFRSSLDGVDPTTAARLNAAAPWPVTAHVTLQRPGVAHAITVTITVGPYSVYLPPAGQRLAGDLGYLLVPHFLPPGQAQETAYLAAAHNFMSTISQAPTCGWVIDLRLDNGGDYKPMILALGSILGSGTFVGWRYRDGDQTWVSYADGRIVQDGTVIATAPTGTPAPPAPRNLPPMAVLIGPQTASSGEVTTLAFVGRPQARLFGEPTGGYTTVNNGYFLFDGTFLLLAEAAMTDRTGATHLAGITPDQPVATNWATFGTGQDPVLKAARAWLRQQPACRQAASASSSAP